MQLITICICRWFGFHAVSGFVGLGFLFYIKNICLFVLFLFLLGFFLFGVMLFYSKYCGGMNVMMKGELLIKPLLL